MHQTYVYTWYWACNKMLYMHFPFKLPILAGQNVFPKSQLRCELTAEMSEFGGLKCEGGGGVIFSQFTPVHPR
jgi:hypothetical protein